MLELLHFRKLLVVVIVGIVGVSDGEHYISKQKKLPRRFLENPENLPVPLYVPFFHFLLVPVE